MASMVLFCFISLCYFHSALAAPAFDNLDMFSAVTLASESNSLVLNQPTSLAPDSLGEILVSPPEPSSVFSAVPQTPLGLGGAQYPFSFSFPTSVATSSSLNEESTTTVTVTEEEVVTITVSATPTTVTETITLSETSTSSTPSDTPVLGPAKTIWTAPSSLADLTPFNVAAFPGGQENLKVVSGIPAKASARPIAPDSLTTTKVASPSSNWDNSSSVIQLLFPAGSINPAQKPQGGAEFYATPIDISKARNVTMKYSVFFPASFDWVLAGKLPGLYGGHTGCSGGNAALDCFSTRLMWRQGGAGELYLYAPKKKQTKALCSDPQSTCDATYGLSIGRGAFKWAAGRWTTVQQTVYLNTPGVQDGSFTLDVNGQRVINRNDVFYRDNIEPVVSDKPAKPKPTSTVPTPTPKKTAAGTTKHAKPTPTSTTDDGGLLGPILGGLLGDLGLRRRETGAVDDIPSSTLQEWDLGADPTDSVVTKSDRGTAPIVSPGPTPSIPLAGTTATVTNTVNTVPTNEAGVGIQSSKSKAEVGLVGIFFSTFFGGHDVKYATPKDQYIWFKDFALAYNA